MKRGNTNAKRKTLAVAFQPVVGLLTVTFYFRDKKFSANEYGWTCELPSIPRIGDEISLPDLEGGGPLYHKDTLWAASNAIVEDVTWFLDDCVEVVVYCDLLWEDPDQPNSAMRIDAMRIDEAGSAGKEGAKK